MQRVEIRIAGHLDEDWSKWLEGFTLGHTGNGETILTGEVEDQAALYGLIAKLRDLGVELAAVRIVSSDEASWERNGSSPGDAVRE
ncbi:MAG: hypothetical protein FJZ97_12810 [Chloroflexi bacterium]|nr:hypothetical protein [Chloroflexota bacterium]